MTILLFFAFSSKSNSQNNYSLLFDGVNDYVELGAVSGFNPNASISLEAIFKWDGPNGVTNHQYLLQFAQSGPGNAALLIYDNGTVAARVLQCNCSTDYLHEISAPILQGVWYHVLYTYDVTNGDMKFYLDGVLVSQSNYPFTGYYAVNNTPSRIGNYHFNSYYFKGSVAFAHISNIAIAPNNYNKCNPSPLTNQSLGYYLLEEGTGTTTNDPSINDNPGTLMNGIVWSNVNPVCCNSPKPHANDILLCGGGITTLTATGGTNYIWYNAPTGGTQIASGATYTTPFLTSSTTYYVSNWNGICESPRDTVVVTVGLLPSVSINPLADYINVNASPISLSGTPTGGIYTGDGVNGSSFNPSTAGLGLHHITYTYSNVSNCSNSATENVIVYDTTGIICSDTLHISVTDTLFIDVTLTGIAPPNNTNTIEIYPNPAHTFVIINTGNYSLMNNYTIKIENMLGQTVYQTLVNQQLFQINVNSFGGYGTYFVKILDNSSNLLTTKKIILY